MLLDVLAWAAGAWLAVSIVLEAAAWRAERLGRRAAPALLRAPPRAGAEASSGSIAFLGDLQRGVADVAGPLAEELERRPADLLVSSGDFAAHGEAPYYGILFDALESAGVATPTRAVPGNHDLHPRRVRDTSLGGAIFERHFGARRFAERVGPVLVVGLDDATQGIEGEPREWLLARLSEHEGVPWICVCHRPPRNLEEPDARAEPDLASFVALLEAKRPALVVSGHKHESTERVVGGVRYVVNAHGGDVHGLALRRQPFDLLRVTVRTPPPRPTLQAESSSLVKIASAVVVERETTRHARRLSSRVLANQLCVRLWCERRKPFGRFLAAPVGLVLAALGRRAPLRRATDPWGPP